MRSKRIKQIISIRGLEQLGLARQVWRIPPERLRASSRLNRSVSKQTAMTDKARKDDPMLHTGSILVVDREPTIVNLLVEILTDDGYIAYTAPDSAGALVAIARHPPALILLDLGPPGMCGAALIEQVRGAGLASMPIVLMTTEPRDAAPLLVPGSIEGLAKPFALDDLLACVARYMPPAHAGERPAALRAAYSMATA